MTADQLALTVQRIASSHKPEAIRLMTMHHFCTSLLYAFGSQHIVSMDPYLTMLDRVVRFYAEHHGITLSERIAASTAISEAGRQLAPCDSPTG